ncbi:STAS domain-containing protein [Planosporangium sp. 12N6]|uniref:STAS domain-containing protein n=1 Tax=Planosporangium spinosum TaxID=3402278 RepID=UPI003CEE4564
MSFRASLRRSGTVVVITLAGVLDAVSAPEFRQQVERAVESTVEHLVLDVSEVGYLSSGGLRMLAYTRQKLPAGVSIALVGANETIQRTIRLVGFHYSLEFSDRLPGGQGDATV